MLWHGLPEVVLHLDRTLYFSGVGHRRSAYSRGHGSVAIENVAGGVLDVSRARTGFRHHA